MPLSFSEIVAIILLLLGAFLTEDGFRDLKRQQSPWPSWVAAVALFAMGVFVIFAGAKV